MIGAAIKTIIRGNTAINAIIENRLYAISESETGTPAMFYSVEATPFYNKNSLGSQLNTFKVKILTMANTYEQAWQLAILTKQAFENAARATVESIKLRAVQCTRIADDYEFIIDTYNTISEFEIKTDNILNN